MWDSPGLRGQRERGALVPCWLCPRRCLCTRRASGSRSTGTAATAHVMPAHGLPSIGRGWLTTPPRRTPSPAISRPVPRTSGRSAHDASWRELRRGAHRVRRVEVGRHQGPAWSAVTARMSRWGSGCPPVPQGLAREAAPSASSWPKALTGELTGTSPGVAREVANRK